MILRNSALSRSTIGRGKLAGPKIPFHEIMSSAKERHRALPADLLADASQFIPPALVARSARVTSEILSSSPATG